MLTKLIQAARDGNIVEIEKCLDDRACINGRDVKHGHTALMKASINGRDDAVRLLLDRGAKIEVKARQTFQTALSFACCFGHVSTVKLLLDRGAMIVAADKFKKTPLHLACALDNTAIVKVLLERGADVHATSNDNWTALHYACERGHTQCVQELLFYGVGVDDLNVEGKSSLDIARGKNHQSIVDSLLKHKLRVSSTNNHETVEEKINESLRRIEIELVQSNTNVKATKEVSMCLSKTLKKMNDHRLEQRKQLDRLNKELTPEIKEMEYHFDKSHLEILERHGEIMCKGMEMNKMIVKMHHDIQECILRLSLLT